MLDGEKKGLNEMPIWQDHERRITTLEVTMEGLSNKMDKVEQTIREGNKEQKEMLDTINTRMVDEFFARQKAEHQNEEKQKEIDKTNDWEEKKLNQKYRWKLVTAVATGVLSGGGIVYIIIEALINWRGDR